MTDDCSAGFMTTGLPATIAAVAMPVRMARGKFQGAITTTTPPQPDSLYVEPERAAEDHSAEEVKARYLASRYQLEFVDLEPDKVMEQLPAELSGGMRKRVGIARGMANNPEIMLYDEPTSGLDPLTTATITYLILKLQRELGVTSVVVSHDIRSAFRMGSKIALLANRRIGFFGTPEEMTGSDDPYIREFLGGF